MIADLRSATLSWLTERVNDRATVYCDIVPEHDTGDTVIAFNITGINPIMDLANHVTLLNFDVEIYINSKDRANIDAIADDLMDDNVGTSTVFEHIFYREFKDLDYSPKLDDYFCSVLSVQIKAHI